MLASVLNQRLSDEEFLEERKEVLKKWPTGAEIELNEAVSYQKSLIPHKNAVCRIEKALKDGEILVESRGGYALVEQNIELHRKLFEEGGTQILPLTVDTYTRTCLFEKAQRGMEESIKAGRSMLNGFPLICQGLKNTRRIVEAAQAPILHRLLGLDNRLQWEMALAGGLSGGPGDAINYYASGCKRDPFDILLKNYKYINRLIGYYEEKGVPIYREFHGCNVGVIMPPSLFNAYSVVMALLAAEQGVKHMCPIFPTNGSLLQDIAGNIALGESIAEYLKRFDYQGIRVYRGVNQWRGHFPTDEAKSFAIICHGAATAAMAGAVIVINKTPHEGIGVATVESHVVGAKSTKLTLSLLKEHRFPETHDFLEEKEEIKKETSAIVDHVLELGNGDLIQGLLKAVKTGAWDAPFSPNVELQGNILPVRDKVGAVRYLSHGNLPFSKEMIEYNQSKIRERASWQGRTIDFDLVIEDILAGYEYMAHWMEDRVRGTKYSIKDRVSASPPVPEVVKRGGKKKPNIITGVIGEEDPHVVATKLLSYVLRKEGFNVVSMGAKCSAEEIVKAAVETDADAVMLTSVAGHAELNCRGFRDMCEEAGLRDILLYIGGNLVPTGDQKWSVVEKLFKELGFNRVYPPATPITAGIEDLKQDFQSRIAKS